MGQLVHARRHLEAEDAGRDAQPLIVIVQTEHAAIVDPFALEDATGVMQPMRQHVQFGLAPRYEPAVVPDEAIAVVEGQHGHQRYPPHRSCCSSDWTGRMAGRSERDIIFHSTPGWYRRFRAPPPPRDPRRSSDDRGRIVYS